MDEEYKLRNSSERNFLEPPVTEASPKSQLTNPRLRSVLHVLRVESCFAGSHKMIPNSPLITAVSVMDPDVSILLIAEFFSERHLFLGPDCIPFAVSRKERRRFTPRAELLPRR